MTKWVSSREWPMAEVADDVQPMRRRMNRIERSIAAVVASAVQSAMQVQGAPTQSQGVELETRCAVGCLQMLAVSVKADPRPPRGERRPTSEALNRQRSAGLTHLVQREAS